MAATWKPPERTGDIMWVREKRGRKYVLVPKYRETRPASEDEAMDEDDEDAQGASSGSTAAAAPVTPQWTLDLQAAQLPEAAAAGQFGGRPFTAERAYLQRTPTGAYVFTVRQGAGYQAERELLVVLPLRAGEQLDGQSWNIAADAANAPRVTKRWLQNARQQTKTFTNGYAMKLQFEQTANNQIPAKLFVALPDEDKTFVAGTVTASFLVAGAAPTQQRRQ
jgi:hypothetical protein